jgi:hypothetical protein
MSGPRLVAVLAAIGTLAVVAGWAGARALDDTGRHPLARVAATSAPLARAPVAPPPEASVEPPELAPDPAVPSGTVPGPPARPIVPRPRTPAPRKPARPRPATTGGAPVVPPPPRTTTTAPTPTTTTAPRVGPPASVFEAPPPPARGIRVPAGTGIAGDRGARSALAAALARTAPGSREASDVRRAIALWTRWLGPRAVSAPAGRRATVSRAVRDTAWWFAHHGSPRGRLVLRDPDGVLLTYRAGQAFSVNPVATIGRWNHLNDDVPATDLAAALLPLGVERRDGDRRFRVWEYFDVAGEPEAIEPGVSGMAQGRVALLAGQAEADGGGPRFAAMARDALAALTVPVDRGGALTEVTTKPGQRPMPWYPERAEPGASPWAGAALNGFMVTLINLRGASEALSQRPGGADAASLARSLADRGAATLDRHLPDHDSGGWSYYGLLTGGRPWKTSLADLNYHCYHVTLLRRLALLYPARDFGDWADRWQGYVDEAGLACPVRP